MAYIEFDKVVKEYPSGGSVIRALDEASFTADEGRLTVILGQSGAGKTTALNILGGMDTATSGRVVVGGRDITGLRSKELVGYRRNDIGFVFQFYNLVPNLTALENVELASQICPDHFDPADTLGKVGLADRLDNFPAQLSGGEQQRVSIARALAQQAPVLLFDEPTSSLDLRNQLEVLDITKQVVRQQALAAVVILHDLNLALRFADRFLVMKDGAVLALGGREVVDREMIWEVYGVRAQVLEVDGRPVVVPR